MQMRDIFVRMLIFSDRMTGIGSEAKRKSVKILIATHPVSLVSRSRNAKMILTSVEEANAAEYTEIVAF